MKPILCLDFDGVLHSYTSGWKGADVIPDPPVEGAREFLLQALAHFQVAIFSSRSNQPGGRAAMEAWMQDQFGMALTDNVSFPMEKPPAMVSLDDRCLCFEGVWPDMDTLVSFQPWNKR